MARAVLVVFFPVLAVAGEPDRPFPVLLLLPGTHSGARAPHRRRHHSRTGVEPHGTPRDGRGHADHAAAGGNLVALLLRGGGDLRGRRRDPAVGTDPRRTT